MKENVEVALRALKWAYARSRKREERDYYYHAITALNETLTKLKEEA